MMKFPFEVSEDKVLAAPELFVDIVFSSLASEFLIMPKGEGFLEYSEFAVGYEKLKKASDCFTQFEFPVILSVSLQCPVVLIVLRVILGFTPPEWAYIASNRKGIDIPQNAARTLDRNIRIAPKKSLKPGTITRARLAAMVETACDLIKKGCPVVPSDKLHRLSKADSMEGLSSVQQLADLGAPYAMLLYERFLGRPFAGHRDSVSELIGDGLESAIEEQLTLAGVTFRKTKRAERISGFDQAPDFIIPDEFHPRVVMEAKLTEDDGTARDKATRIIRLCQMSEQRVRNGKPGYQVIACLAGRGFGIRREDMRQMIIHTKGKVFTPKTLDRLVDCSNLLGFRTKKNK
jgi:hypothetical protein